MKETRNDVTLFLFHPFSHFVFVKQTLFPSTSDQFMMASILMPESSVLIVGAGTW